MRDYSVQAEIRAVLIKFEEFLFIVIFEICRVELLDCGIRNKSGGRVSGDFCSVKKFCFSVIAAEMLVRYLQSRL